MIKNLRLLGKKGQMALPAFNIFTFVIFSFLVVLFFAGWIYITGQLNDVFTQVGLQNDAIPHPNVTTACLDNASNTCTGNSYVNMTLASNQIFGTMNDSIKDLRWVSMVYILALAACIILTAGLQRISPMFFFAYILIVGLAMLFAPMISNSYETLLASGIYGGELANFTASNFLLANLPTVTLIVGLLGAIFLFTQLIRQEGENIGGSGL